MNKESGLTMVELLATIAILVATVTFVLVLGNRAVLQTGLFAAHTQATFLAKEAMELLEDDSFRGQISEETQSFWRIDYLGIEKATNQEECYQRLKAGADRFIKISGTDEFPFSRCVIATRSEGELKIEVDVAFEYQNNDHNISLYRIFYE